MLTEPVAAPVTLPLISNRKLSASEVRSAASATGESTPGESSCRNAR